MRWTHFASFDANDTTGVRLGKKRVADAYVIAKEGIADAADYFSWVSSADVQLHSRLGHAERVLDIWFSRTPHEKRLR